MSEIQRSILATLCYFDMFDYPMKLEEIWKYAIRIQKSEFRSQNSEVRIQKFVPSQVEGLERSSIKNNIKLLIDQKKIEEKDGFYFLSGRHEIVEIRKQRYKISLKKIKKARRMVFWLRFIPWIKAVFICSSLAYLNAPQESDIDLLIITNQDSIWSARFWSVGILKILGLRPKNNQSQDKFCLSYFISQDNLNLEGTKINTFDIHLIYLLSHHLPLYFEDNLWQKFNEANKWIGEYLLNLDYQDEFSYQSNVNEYANFLIKPHLLGLKKLICQTQLRWEEKLYKKIQLKIMPKILKQMINKVDNKVIINDKMIKLHSNDKREKYFKIWFWLTHRINFWI